VRKPELRTLELGEADPTEALVETVTAWVDKAGALQDVPGFDFERLRPGNVVPGPAIVWTPITTLVVPPGQQARVDEYRNLVMTAA
jgi:N-methylhydantoinase A